MKIKKMFSHLLYSNKQKNNFYTRHSVNSMLKHFSEVSNLAQSVSQTKHLLCKALKERKKKKKTKKRCFLCYDLSI